MIHRRLTPVVVLLVQGCLLAGSPLQNQPRRYVLPGGTGQVDILGNGQYQIHREGQAGERLRVRSTIHLRKASMDPLSPAAMAAGPRENLLRVRQAEAFQGKAFLVQFHTQALPDYQREIAGLGGACHVPVPDQAMVVLMDKEARRRVEQLPYVRWVGPYLPTYKLDSGLDEVVEAGAGAMADYNVMLLDRNLAGEVARKLRSLGISADGDGPALRLQARLNGAQLGLVSQMDEVLFIDPVTEGGDDLDLVRPSSGVNELESLAGYAGEGVRGEICETQGMLVTHEAFRANPLTILSTGLATSHGTPVASCLFGGGSSEGLYRGILPKGTGFFFSLYSLNNGSYPSMAQRETHVAEMVNPSLPYRIVFQSYSNGNTLTSSYNTYSAANDDMLFKHDLLTFQSQSNDSSTLSRPQAWSKNVVAVGGMDSKGTVDMADDVKSRSSYGYAQDGRMKPDLAHYFSVIAARDNSDTTWAKISGTSFSTPVTAGLGGLVMQMWADGVFDGGPGKNRDVFASRPHAATARALMINSAQQWTFTGTDSDRDRKYQGWGMANVKNLYDTAMIGGWRLPVLVDEAAPIAPQAVHSYHMLSNSLPLKATLVYRDPAGNPAATKARINDLDLKVISPSGLVYWGNFGLKEGNWSMPGGEPNDVDTVENVFIEKPEPGIWTIQIHGTEIIQDAHPATGETDAVYALVTTGGLTAVLPPHHP